MCPRISSGVTSFYENLPFEGYLKMFVILVVFFTTKNLFRFHLAQYTFDVCKATDKKKRERFNIENGENRVRYFDIKIV